MGCASLEDWVSNIAQLPKFNIAGPMGPVPVVVLLELTIECWIRTNRAARIELVDGLPEEEVVQRLATLMI